MKIYILFLSTWALFSCTNHNTDKKLEETINKVVKAFKEKDAASLNTLIHPDYKLAVVYRSGVFDEFALAERIDFDNPVPNYFPYPNFSTSYPIRYETCPTYDCDEEKWDKYGLFCNPKQVDHLLSATAKNLNEYVEENMVSAEKIEGFVKLEEKSKRVVLVDEKGGTLIFYITPADGNWYITVLDRVTGDCSS
jgi:hypothetical protein